MVGGGAYENPHRQRRRSIGFAEAILYIVGGDVYENPHRPRRREYWVCRDNIVTLVGGDVLDAPFPKAFYPLALFCEKGGSRRLTG